MAFDKNSALHKSGMRGNEPPAEPDPSAAPEPGGEDIGSVVAQHVHGPDENGHHHLNLSTLAEHLSKHGGKR
jgi:hypothetical protein